ncbi:MAG: YbhB/YbcL family Raf kinase inhibitor-like protein [Gemmatimonadetes bacterium]|nr:YbhB/YbcL family Raf kinase inhibitor-like protein [Gemmatimonadota bacterium]
MRTSRRFLVLLALASAAPLSAQAPARATQQAPARPPFTLQAVGLVDGGLIPWMLTQAAPEVEYKGGVSPKMTWANPPAGTRSFVLHMHDMEVARNKTTEDQLHWLVWNIPGDSAMLPFNIPEGATIAKLGGAFQINGRGAAKYLGPGAPATGPLHHYMFELIALDTKLNVQPTADGFETRKKVMDALQGHVLGKALTVGMFKRPPT